ncbi:unnamed protein product, partial [Thelazia callipaeda]|uniref:UBC core domain-containing protein n=1 Tax=Thelazia callipaeda TaxID=103827 RepID=A0A0N5D4T9_THECL
FWLRSPKKLLKISPEEHKDGLSPPLTRISSSVIRELCTALLSSDPIPRPGSAQIKLDVNAEPPWDPDPFYYLYVVLYLRILTVPKLY